MNLGIYLPKYMAASSIEQGSAIVSEAPEDKYLNLYFEGNLFGAENLKLFSEKLYHASSRLVHKYPTVARMVVHEQNYLKVGEFDYDTKTIDLDPDKKDLFMQWIGEDVTSISDLNI